MGAIISNDMTLLIKKISRRLGLIPLEAHLPEFCNKDKWIDVIMEDTLVTFSRFFPNKFKMYVTDETCFKKYDESHVLWYYIKDEILQGAKLLGMRDIDFMDTSNNNNSLGATSQNNYFYPAASCPVGLFEDLTALQLAADFNSLYNRTLYIDFRYPNKFAIKGIGNTNYDLSRFTVVLLVQHCSLSTISPTMMETFENLAIADVAKFLYENLKYYDGLDTAFVSIDMKLSELNDEANKRDSIIEQLDIAHVSASSDTTPYIFTV